MIRFVVFLSILLATSAWAHPEDEAPVKVTEGVSIRLQRIPFTRPPEKKTITETELDYRSGIHDFSAHGVDLGMNDVPVLDQGEYGTCVTFASTAAFDALYGLGDYISQQCFLSLSKYLGNNIWYGAFTPSEVFGPLNMYGLVAHSACPYVYPDAERLLPPAEYTGYVSLINKVQTKFLDNPTLADVKAALDRGNRVLVAFLLQNSSDSVKGFNVVKDGKTYQGGIWACKQYRSRNYCTAQNAGHEVIIIGYDDDQKLLKIRNSWSDKAGENGDYYMSYKYFQSNVSDTTEVFK